MSAYKKFMFSAPDIGNSGVRDRRTTDDDKSYLIYCYIIEIDDQRSIVQFGYDPVNLRVTTNVRTVLRPRKFKLHLMEPVGNHRF